MEDISHIQRNVFIAIGIGILATCLCFLVRQQIFPGPGDFNWALKTAEALINGEDPYDFTPSALHVPYPLPVALFGLPFLRLHPIWAGALFFGLSSGLLAYGILRKNEPWRLIIFLTFPYFYALLFAQWSPLITAAWFFPILAPLLALVKPNIALPIAISKLTLSGVFLAGMVFLISLMIYPSWPWRWLEMTRHYESIIPILVLPFGPLLLLTLFYWRDERARLLLGMALLPFRGVYDLLALWLIPLSRQQMLLLTTIGWIIPIYDSNIGLTIKPMWAIPTLFLSALTILLLNKCNK